MIPTVSLVIEEGGEEKAGLNKKEKRTGMEAYSRLGADFAQTFPIERQDFPLKTGESRHDASVLRSLDEGEWRT